MAVTLTEAAAKHVQKFLTRRGKGVGLRLGVKTSVSWPAGSLPAEELEQPVREAKAREAAMITAVNCFFCVNFFINSKSSFKCHNEW